MQVLQYLDGQKYSSHFDYFHDTVIFCLIVRMQVGGLCQISKSYCLPTWTSTPFTLMNFLQVNTANGGQRVGTVLMYLTDVEEGGETVFPSSLDHPVISTLNPIWNRC